MGYGGSRADAGEAIGRSGDEGIDGIINEDRLGLDVVYVQAKRWDRTVGRPEVQAFAGSLEGQRAQKGVMITTSAFSPDAHQYVKQIGKKIVLIDGHELAELHDRLRRWGEHDAGICAEGDRHKLFRSGVIRLPFDAHLAGHGSRDERLTMFSEKGDLLGNLRLETAAPQRKLSKRLKGDFLRVPSRWKTEFEVR